jgi:hypothetical protein
MILCAALFHGVLCYNVVCSAVLCCAGLWCAKLWYGFLCCAVIWVLCNWLTMQVRAELIASIRRLGAFPGRDDEELAAACDEVLQVLHSSSHSTPNLITECVVPHTSHLDMDIVCTHVCV